MLLQYLMVFSDIVCAVAGITSDANILIDYARLTCQRYQFNYHEPMPVEQLVQAICNLKQSYTQHGGTFCSFKTDPRFLGMRPFGTSFLWAGWDKVFGFQLYQSDPSGNYGGWKATCIGSNNTTAQSIFKTDYETDTMELRDAKKLLVKVLSKTVEGATIVGEKLEFTLLQVRDGKTLIQRYAPSEIDTMVKECSASPEAA